MILYVIIELHIEEIILMSDSMQTTPNIFIYSLAGFQQVIQYCLHLF